MEMRYADSSSKDCQHMDVYWEHYKSGGGFFFFFSGGLFAWVRSGLPTLEGRRGLE